MEKPSVSGEEIKDGFETKSHQMKLKGLCLCRLPDMLPRRFDALRH